MLADWGVSIRRACKVLPVDTSTYHYKSHRADPAMLKKRIKEICETHVRYGYRRVYYILRRDGWLVNMKKVYRLYRELGLQLRNKTPKRRVKAKLREDRTTAAHSNDVWAIDFVHDQLATGRKLRILKWWTHSHGSLRCWMRGSVIVVRTWSPRWKRPAASLVTQRRSESTMAANLSLATWIFGPTSGA